MGKSRSNKIAAMYQRLWMRQGNTRQLLLLVLDLLLVPSAIYLSILARVGIDGFPDPDSSFLVTVLVTTIISAVVFLSLGLYRAVVRFMGGQAILAVTKGVLISAAIFGFSAFLTESWMPRSLPFIYALIALALIGGSRLLIRAYYQRSMRKSGHLAIIYGAGEAGRHLMSAINHGERYRAALFVDDNPLLLNRTIAGIAVKHPQNLPELVESTGARYVFLAIPSLNKERRREIIESLMHLHVHVKTVPSLEELLDGSSLENVQEIDIDDLLGRAQIPPNAELLDRCVSNRSVMVTGAGGSIGSELSRQITHCSPKRLILLEQSEYLLHKIEREICELMSLQESKFELICLLASVQDRARLEQIFEVYDIDTIYHAAAYKHVPIVEHNILDGLKNNVIGTYNMVHTAAKYHVETFTLISTDKAVRPTNVMGASKRFAELVLQAYATKKTETKFCMVRFGNVLGSSGSVVPIFREQILAGGPVTVTHKDVIRYFMTIPEAAQLVLQASAMGEGGDVFLLDMGEPVSILELAKRMIWLMGREIKNEDNPHGDIEIEFTGLRPGEKLYEELLIGENASGTGHPMIMRAQEDFLPWEQLQVLVDHLAAACDSGACDVAIDVLSQAVPEYNQKQYLHDTIWEQRNQLRQNQRVTDNVISGGFRENVT